MILDALQQAIADVKGTGDPHVCGQCQRSIAVGEWPWCPHGLAERPFAVIGDTVIGGARMFENLGPQPVWIESKSQLRAELKARGLREHVRHTPVPGTDKSPQTVRWI